MSNTCLRKVCPRWWLESAVLVLATLAFLFPAAACMGQPKQSHHEFFAVLIDAATQKPVPAARVILAPKTEGKYECTIDTSLTGVSNERGEVRIPNLNSGEYCIFYNLSGSIHPALKGKVVKYGGPPKPGRYGALPDYLPGPLVLTREAKLVTFDGRISVANAEIESKEFDLRMTTTAEGALLTARVPSAGGPPVRIEIGPPQPSKSGH